MQMLNKYEGMENILREICLIFSIVASVEI